jgi:hypothetical protein
MKTPDVTKIVRTKTVWSFSEDEVEALLREHHNIPKDAVFYCVFEEPPEFTKEEVTYG